MASLALRKARSLASLMSFETILWTEAIAFSSLSDGRDRVFFMSSSNPMDRAESPIILSCGTHPKIHPRTATLIMDSAMAPALLKKDLLMSLAWFSMTKWEREHSIISGMHGFFFLAGINPSFSVMVPM